MSIIAESDITLLIQNSKKFRISNKEFLITGGAGFLVMRDIIGKKCKSLLC